MEISPNVHLIPGITANPYLIIDKDGLTLIDAGMPGSRKKILRYLSDLGFAPKDLKRIIITHADFDHVGGLSALKAISGARIYASAVEAEGIAAGHPTRPINTRSALLRSLFSLLTKIAKPGRVIVDEILSDGQVLPILGGLRVLETIGHTPGHISLFAGSAGILFSGDSVVSDEKGLYSSREAVTWDRLKADASTQKQAALKPKIVCPGHGPVVLDAEGKFPRF
jgi:glyoxylase-like metal-dependent hydrolase (beta-lactamase superfamily II)